MEQRFPDVSKRGIDEDDADRRITPVPVTETGGEFESAGATADDHDAVGMVLRSRHWNGR
jgi:hypothetical protein